MKWLKRLRGALGTGLTWAVAWAAAGIAIGASSLLFPGLWQGFFQVFDAPLPALAVPGFFAGLFFAVVVSVAARRRRLEDLSLRQIATWGALGGVLVTLFPFALVAVGLASREGSSIGTAQILVAITPPFVLLSVASATATLAMARAAARRRPSESDEVLHFDHHEDESGRLTDDPSNALGDGARDIPVPRALSERSARRNL